MASSALTRILRRGGVAKLPRLSSGARSEASYLACLEAPEISFAREVFGVPRVLPPSQTSPPFPHHTHKTFTALPLKNTAPPPVHSAPAPCTSALHPPASAPCLPRSTPHATNTAPRVMSSALPATNTAHPVKNSARPWLVRRFSPIAADDGVALQSESRSRSQPGEESIGLDVKGVSLRGRPLYLDMQATSPVDPRVLDAMMPFFVESFGNPHSRTHLYGWESESAAELARAQVADLVGANPKEIIFTSGATESNNIAIKGVAHFYRDKKRHVITAQTEHKCVLDSCRALQQEGFDVTYLPVKPDGLIDLDQLKSAIRDDTALVSIMAVNNEIGVIQPLKEIGAICRERKVFFHTDAAQAVGKVPVDVNDLNIDLMSISGHKLYGPKGVGALYVRRRPRVRVEPQMSGGGQERGLRSGTLPTPIVVGLGAACQLAKEEMERDLAHVARLNKRLLDGVSSCVTGVQVNGSLEHRYLGNLNISFAYVEGESLLMGLKEVAVSSGSACTSASLEPSYVLRALGVEEDMAHTSIRFGIGRFTTEEEVDYAVELTVAQVEKLREMSPLWEMVQDGVDLKSIQWSQH